VSNGKVGFAEEGDSYVMSNVALVVDDDGASRFLLHHMLKRTGFSILEAENGIQALNMLQSAAPDIVFLDMLMPGVNGSQVLEYMRSSPLLVNIPVIIVSAHSDYYDLRLLGPRDTFLLKPIKPQDIQGALEKANSSFSGCA